MSDVIFKPMLAGKFDPATQRFPAIGSYKLDGIRCMAMGGKPMSRSMKLIPNLHIQNYFSAFAAMLEGLDGELIVGDVFAPDVYRTTASYVMSNDKVIPNFTYYVFDLINRPGSTYQQRLLALQGMSESFHPRVKVLAHAAISSPEEMDSYEAEALAIGAEGIMLRDPRGPYKQGRSSTKEGILLKVKRYEDAEAEIIGIEEEMFNGNEAQTNELGRTKRSSAQAGLVGKGTMGALVVRGINGPFKGVEFNIGTGFTAEQRAAAWPLGMIVTYKFFAIGVKDKPRHPVFQRIRLDGELIEAA